MKIALDPILEGRDVTIVAGGSSLKGFDFSKLRGAVIAVNDAFRYCDADIMVACDKEWWKHNDTSEFKGIKISGVRTYAEDHIGAYVSPDHSTKDLDWHVEKCNLSGYTALAVAFHLGAAHVWLLGYDGGFDGNESNFYKNRNPNVKSDGYEQQNEFYEAFRHYPIINVGLESKIKAFVKVPLNSYFYGYRIIGTRKVQRNLAEA